MKTSSSDSDYSQPKQKKSPEPKKELTPMQAKLQAMIKSKLEKIEINRKMHKQMKTTGLEAQPTQKWK